MDSQSRLKRKRSSKKEQSSEKQRADRPSSKKQKKSSKDEGPACSMFLSDLQKKLALKRKEQDEKRREEDEVSKNSSNFLHTIIKNISKIPHKLSRSSSKVKPTSSRSSAPQVKIKESDNVQVLETIEEPPHDVESLKEILAPASPTNVTAYSPSMLSAAPIILPVIPSKQVSPTNLATLTPELVAPIAPPQLAIPNPAALPSMVKPELTKPHRKVHDIRMPIVDSEVFKTKKRKTEDSAVNTVNPTDVVSEIARHVCTLKRISMIAEEFNKKTAKNLKEIVDSVQEDLLKKMEEIQQSQKTSKIEIQTELT